MTKKKDDETADAAATEAPAPAPPVNKANVEGLVEQLSKYFNTLLATGFTPAELRAAVGLAYHKLQTE